MHVAGPRLGNAQDSKDASSDLSLPPGAREDILPEGVTLATLSFIARSMARDHSIRVFIGEPGEGSFANLEQKCITLDPDHLKSAAEARFVAAHEGAHIGESPSLTILGIRSAQERQEYQKKIGLHPLWNVVEDGAINDRFCRKFRKLQPDTLEAYPRVAASDSIGIIHLPEVQAITAVTGKPPLYAQALAGLLGDWVENRHQLGFERTLEEYQAQARQGGKVDDPRLNAFFDSSLQEARRAISFIPEPNDPVSKSLEMGVKRFTWCAEVLYPELKKLVDADLGDIQDALKRQPNSAGSEGGGAGGGEGEGQQADHEGDTKGTQQGDQQGSPQANQQDSTASNSSSTDEQSQKVISDAEAQCKAKELLAQAEAAIRALLESLKGRAEDSARASSDDKKKQDEGSEQEQIAGSGGSRGSIARRRKETVIHSLVPYRQEYREMAAAIEKAYNRLSDVFDPARQFKWESGLPSGAKLNLNAAMRFELTGQGHQKIWKRRVDPQYPDHDVVVLIDRSSSMSGINSVFARRATLFARELFQRLNIPTACVGFGNIPRLFVEFDDDIGESEVQTSFMNNTEALPEGTNDAAAVRFAASLLEDRNAADRSIVMISDAGSGAGYQLKSIVRKLANDGIPVLHFGIGPHTRDYQGNYIHSWGDLRLDTRGPSSFLEVFCREMERLAVGSLQKREEGEPE